MIVAVAHHYTPDKTMPPFAAELERLGFRTTVINPDREPEKEKHPVTGETATISASNKQMARWAGHRRSG